VLKEEVLGCLAGLSCGENKVAVETLLIMETAVVILLTKPSYNSLDEQHAVIVIHHTEMHGSSWGI
jgi:hypothetical protein